MSDQSLGVVGATRRTLTKGRPYDVFIVGRLGDSRVTVLHELRLSDAVKRSEAWLSGKASSDVVEIWLEGVVCVWSQRGDGRNDLGEQGDKPNWPLTPGRHRWRSKTDDWVAAS